VTAVEEILDFKGVPEGKRVSLVATKFWGRVAATETNKGTTRQAEDH
jgi:hypothetical protein